jgi:hypothetical protein
MEARSVNSPAYGDAWKRFPVNVGEVWRVGNHVIGCGDLERGFADAFLSRHETPSFSYVDPPWGKSVAEGFREKAGVPSDVDFLGRLMPAIFRAIGQATRAILLEYGVRGLDDVLDVARREGLYEVARWPGTYNGGRSKCHYVQLGRVGEQPMRLPDLSGLDEPDVIVAALHGRSGVLFDPCMGQGLAAVSAERLGIPSLGTELHPRRVSRTIERLVTTTGCAPRLEGTI